MSLSILGIGTAVPQYSANQLDAAQIARQFVCTQEDNDGWFDKVYELSTVQYRGSVLLEEPDENGAKQSFYPRAVTAEDRGPSTAQRMQRYSQTAAPLAIEASKRALFESNTTPDEITHLITISCTGFGAPGIDFALIRNLGLSPSVNRVQIGFMGCHAAINAFVVARAIGEADPQAKILMCSVELCSLHYHYGWDPSKIVANALFADGAAAIVASGVADGTCAGHDTNGHDTNGKPANGNARKRWSVRTTGSQLLPNTDEAMTWTIGDHGFEMTLEPSVPDLIREQLRDWMDTWLSQHSLKVSDIGSWAIHPGGPKIIGSVALALGLYRHHTEASRYVLTKHGNMSSATTLFVIDRLQQLGAPTPCVALAFGPGLVVESALFD